MPKAEVRVSSTGSVAVFDTTLAVDPAKIPSNRMSITAAVTASVNSAETFAIADLVRAAVGAASRFLLFAVGDIAQVLLGTSPNTAFVFK